jgi:glycosyltransferase involved in cell wall biosynthesis
MRVVQVGSVAGSAEMLGALLAGHVDLISLPIAQAAARRSGIAKIASSPLRAGAAIAVARDIRRFEPDVVHIHWAPNALVGPLSRRPWVLHARGSDIRGINALRRTVIHPLLKMADAVLVSTPDLLDALRPVRSDGIYVPNPVLLPATSDSQEWDVGLASAAIPVKGTDIAHAALSQMNGVRAWALEGPLFQPASGAVKLPSTTKTEFIKRVVRTRVVVGQLKLGVLGNVELEAMAAARPVIAFVDEKWYPSDPPPVISARSPNEVARAVSDLLSNPERAEHVGAASREWVRRNHGFSRVRDQLLQVYDAVMTNAITSSVRPK